MELKRTLVKIIGHLSAGRQRCRSVKTANLQCAVHHRQVQC